MSQLVPLLVAVLGLWLCLCLYTGFALRLGLFCLVVLAGLALNMAWMVMALEAHPFEVNALVAQGSLVTYGLCAFGLGWFAGRMHRRWQASRLDRDGDED